MNEYLISAYIKGKSTKIETSHLIKALNKEDAIKKLKKFLEDEGFIYDGIDYCDWVG